ncbi:PTS sugar transporter subunit IIA [Acetonema longum]|uniref:Putative PTS system IIA component n=1 Tax=Acetonema longum DSM 6540 TaxID=1009370 RepID=F7NLJ7_9FIRM|nr:PTS sugar transporter subunit IIA [Acetonema longum]EGO63092.1 putative PTS system IIA component [Acetonema longum DSM 6540]
MADDNAILPGSIPGIILVTHGRFGEELIRSAEMIVGAMESVRALSLMPGMEPDDFLAAVKTALESMPEGSLLISDLFGGTPANVSAAISTTRNIGAVSGLSLSMLIEAASSRMALRGEALAEAVVQAGRNNCRNILAQLRGIDSV